MMAIRNYHPFTQEGVFARMNDMAGIRYYCADLAKLFKVTGLEMRIVLDRLVALRKIKTGRFGSGRHFWVETKQEQEVVEREVFVHQFRPLKGYEASMRRFAEMAEKGR
jgi:hypothetical protein